MNIFFVGNSTFINKFVKVTARDTQLLKLSVRVANGLLICSTSIKSFSVHINSNILCENKDSNTWF